MRNLAVITGVPEELNDGTSAHDYSIGPILESGLFNEVVLAVPDMGESKQMRDVAERFGIRFLAGDPVNVCRRIRQALDFYPSDTVSRFQLRASWVDMNLVKASLKSVHAGHDYADFAFDVNYAMGSDTFSVEAFEQVEKYIQSMEHGDRRKKTFEFSPWALLQDRTLFNVGTIQISDQYSKEKAMAIRERLNTLIGNKQNMIGSPVDQPALRYVKTAEFIEPNWSVGEISCGYGGGAAFLSTTCLGVTAFDISSEYILHAKANYSTYAVKYIHGNDIAFGCLEGKFDCVVSLHTLEHVDDDLRFLQNVYRALKIGGTFILEVPRLMPIPMGMPLWPFHEREYQLEDVQIKLTSCGFQIDHELGVSRNDYCDISKAREAMMFIARKRK